MRRAALIIAACLLPSLGLADDVLRLACFGRDVPSIDPLSPAFDPDSYTVITQIFDPLVYLDLDGQPQPGLATAWRQLEPTLWEFTLRQGVTFHNGEAFDAGAVKFTFDYILDPKNKAGNAWIFASVESVDLVDGDDFRVRFRTRFPDGMFIARHSMFGSICPPGYFQQVGPERFASHPVGTGPFRFQRRVPNQTIELSRNPDYWREDLPQVSGLHFLILPEETWVDAFAEGKIDFLPNLAGNQTTLLMQRARGDARILKRLVLSGYQVLLRNKGPLADRRVRRALNHAVNKQALVRYADFGNAVAVPSLGKKGELGANPNLKPYAYDPQRARALLDQAKVVRPLTLRAIVADVAQPVGKIVAFDLSRVGIQLDVEVVSRSEWSRRVVGHKLLSGQPADYDLAINLVDNPIHDLAFHAGLFLHSESPWSLLEDATYDQLYGRALESTDPREHLERLRELDRYIHEQALMVFTTQRVITAAVRRRLSIPGFALSGHLDYLVLSSARYSSPEQTP